MPWPSDEYPNFDTWFDSWFVLSEDEFEDDEKARAQTHYVEADKEVTGITVCISGHENWSRDEWESSLISITHEMRHAYQHMSFDGKMGNVNSPVSDGKTYGSNDDRESYFTSDLESDAYMWEEMCTPQ